MSTAAAAKPRFDGPSITTIGVAKLMRAACHPHVSIQPNEGVGFGLITAGSTKDTA